MLPNGIGVEDSGAFVETFVVEPYRSGPLDGLAFTVKDNIDVAGHKTSYGSKAWQARHAAAVHNAVCVEQLLAAGATCRGKVVADEFTYSLDGENPFFGTPLNPRAPERVPGGSSSGSASSVACGLADFSIGTDSGGSVRVPSSFCGIWGMRPSLHRISEAGVLPFMPSVSTVGAMARDPDVLDRVMRVLLCSREGPAVEIETIYLLEDAFALADAGVRAAAEVAIRTLADDRGITLSPVAFADIVRDDMDLVACNERALRDLQTAEFGNTVGGWIETVRPDLGPVFTKAYRNVEAFDRRRMVDSLARCRRLYEGIAAFLRPGRVICFPTAPTVAPRKGSLNDLEAVRDFYGRTMAVTSFAGVGRLPEISVPMLEVDGCPVGLSLAAGRDQDEFLLATAKALRAAGS